MQHIQVPIRCVITPTQSLSNPIRQVVPLISHMHLYPPHHSHLPPPSLSFSSTTLPSLQNTKFSHPSLSLHVMIMSWHQVQHTPSTRIHWVQHTLSTAFTKDCLSSLHSQDYKSTPECSFSFLPASLHDRPPSASSPWELYGRVTFSHSHSCESTNWWIESQHPVRCPSTASISLSRLVRLRPLSSHDHGLQVHLQTHTISACKCISNLARSKQPSVSLNPHDYGHQTCSITDFKCNSELSQSRSWCASLSSLDHGVHAYLQTC